MSCLSTKDCVIISGTLEVKFRDKFFAYFQRRFVQLVFADDHTHHSDDQHVSSRYELRLFKDKHDCKSPLYSFVIDPESAICCGIASDSKSRPFCFECTVNQSK